MFRQSSDSTPSARACALSPSTELPFATCSGNDQLSKTATYFSELLGLAYLLIGLFGVVFYALCYLYSHRYVSMEAASASLGAWWLASAMYFARRIFRSFARIYRSFLTRLRLYTFMRGLLQWYLGFSLLIFPFLLSVLSRYETLVSEALATYSIKTLIGAHGVSLLAVFYFYTVVVKLVAWFRGTSSSKR